MAVLTDEQRKEIWAEWMSEMSRDGDTVSGLTKADLRAALGAADQQTDDTAAASKAAIPEPARTAMSNNEIAGLYVRVAQKRWEVT